MAVGKVNGLRSKKIYSRYAAIPYAFPAATIPRKAPILLHHFLHFPGERLFCAFIPAEQVIEYIHRKLILIVRDDYLIPALAEIVGCRAHCALQL